MSSTLLLILITVGAVLLFVLGLSITLIVKGRHLQSEVGENDEMKKRGITCTARQMYEDDARLRGIDPETSFCGEKSCGACSDRSSCAE